MEAVLVNYKDAVRKDSSLYRHVHSSYPTNITGSVVVGLVIIVSKDVVFDLSNLKDENDERIKFINDLSPTEFYYVIFNKTRRKCLIPFHCTHLNIVVDSLIQGLPNDVLLYTLVNLDDFKFSETIERFAKEHFGHPFFIDETFVLSRQNVPTEKHDFNSIMNEVVHLLKEQKTNDCSITLRFSSSAISLLKKTSKVGFVVNIQNQNDSTERHAFQNGVDSSQKELTGELVVDRVDQSNSEPIYVIGVNEGSLKSGSEEEVHVDKTRYSFHSHPEQAYVRYNVEKAWPSSTDYIGYLGLGTRTIFHAVATLEGLYILSFTSHWVSKLDSIDKTAMDFIDQYYAVDHKEQYTPKQYVEHVNGIKYKGHPIFHVQFLPWKEASSTFKVFFLKENGNCFSTDKHTQRYKELS